MKRKHSKPAKLRGRTMEFRKNLAVRFALGVRNKERGALIRAFPRTFVRRANLVGVGMAVKPNFLGLGVEKAGTTTVAYHLSTHPEVSFPSNGTKEIHYFDDLYEQKSPSWYFEKFDKNVRVGEFTALYLRRYWARDRIHDLLGPDVKFIVGLRDPIARAFSHYCHLVNRVREQLFIERGYPND